MTIAIRPSERARTVGDVEVIWVKREQEYFSMQGWTRSVVLCPSGRSGLCGQHPTLHNLTVIWWRTIRMVSLRPILRDARLQRAPQDEDFFRGKIAEPHGEEQGNALRLEP